MDQEPPRLKHQGGWLAAAIHTLESELPSKDQLNRLHVDVCSGLDPDEIGSGVREKPRAKASGSVDRADPPRSRRVRRSARKRPAGADPERAAPLGGAARSEPRTQPSWRTVVAAAAAGALLTLALSSAWHGVPRPAAPGDASTATAAAPAPLILREVVASPAPASASRRAAPPPPAPEPRAIPSVALESALGPALPEVWEAPDDQKQHFAYRDGDLWWLHPEAAGGGRLKLNSNPISRVTVDGTVLGLTPIVDAWVPAGKHTVTFDHPIFGRKRRTVEVSAGATEVVAVWFGNEPQH